MPRINASGPARRADHWRSVDVVEAADPRKATVISGFTCGQHIDSTGYRVGDIVVCAVNAVAAISCSTTLELFPCIILLNPGHYDHIFII